MPAPSVSSALAPDGSGRRAVPRRFSTARQQLAAMGGITLIAVLAAAANATAPAASTAPPAPHRARFQVSRGPETYGAGPVGSRTTDGAPVTR
ncbi:hypothetical protein [Streptomyces daghestanicus]|uniref:Uncharacterized protein n=1 Tax=Streptomyces daghestanicus TaxID=66885 RepID=A0ABQ3PVX4_9ACTN|nr:hypothetical protein [Streptomyces daghestanicus]GGU52967.1 hypothetical protein GCM10010259_50360 [Streptomyces daghestanicus]GHI29175.1 hypothetical protein Sdagh_09050 [Streptomyces daghestanicus]